MNEHQTQKIHPPGLWVGQYLHLACLALMLLGLLFSWIAIEKPLAIFFWAAVALPIVHQLFVWFCWRQELNSAAISRSIGFKVYLVIFFTLFLGRFITLALLAWFDSGSLQLPTVVQTLATVLLLLPGLYAMYSVKRYFGMARAAGADHFFEHYRKMPFIKEGIFRYTNNAMYIFAFLLFWAIAIGFNSISALIVALYSHLYIWVHYYSTEKPDMDYLY